jgi:hypothetical protein
MNDKKVPSREAPVPGGVAMLAVVRSGCRRWMVRLSFALLLALVVGVPAPRSLGAETRTGHDFTYYSDNTYTTIVGYQFWCIGYNGGWGDVTPYVVIGDYPCEGQ